MARLCGMQHSEYGYGDFTTRLTEEQQEQRLSAKEPPGRQLSDSDSDSTFGEAHAQGEDEKSAILRTFCAFNT